MSHNERIFQIIYNTLDEVNDQLPNGKVLNKSPETVLFGKSGVLDSLGLVSLIVALEQNIRDEFGVDVTLADERAMSQQKSPFKTIKSLSEYVALLLAKDEINGD